MKRIAIRFPALIFIASTALGCSGTGKPAREEYRPVLLSGNQDPLSPRKTVLPWHPPKQMAVYIHPHEDREQGVMIGGHWILVLLGEGSWYFQDVRERDPVPDQEMTKEELRPWLRALSETGDAVVPYREREE